MTKANHLAPTKPAAPQRLLVLAQRFSAVRARTAALAAPLSVEDCALQSMPDASPVKWHLGHTTWFFETFVLESAESDFRAHDPAFRVLFNSYYNAVGAKHPRPQRGLLSRPSLSEVLAYRSAVERRILALLEHGTLSDVALELIVLGTHHEEQHQELILTDLKHLLAQNPLRPAYHPRWPLVAVMPQALAWHAYAGGLVEQGHAPSAEFAFDNEGPCHRQYVAPFALASRPATYGEYAAFIADAGYQRHELWLSMGWDWLAANRITAPLYWENRGTDQAPEWWNYTLTGMVPIEENTPVCHLSYFEADAFARWAGGRLPTEAEWEHAARQAWPATSALQGNFMESGAHHPLPSSLPAQAGVPVQLFGDVWEWTQSSYAAYPGFKAAPGAVGEYNGKFMCNQYVLRGGSCATPRDHLRVTYRNFFPPEARWQFSGVRLARDVAP